MGKSQKIAISALLLVGCVLFFSSIIGAKAKPEKSAAAEQMQEQWNAEIKARTIVRAYLKDPDSAEFKMKGMNGGLVCGTVNARNGFGGYTGHTPFVANILDTEAIILDGTNKSEFQEIWNRFCLR